MTRAGTTDSFAVRVRVADTGARADERHRVEAQFICAPVALSKFLDAISRARSRGDTRLMGDAEATA